MEKEKRSLLLPRSAQDYWIVPNLAPGIKSSSYAKGQIYVYMTVSQLPCVCELRAQGFTVVSK